MIPFSEEEGRRSPNTEETIKISKWSFEKEVADVEPRGYTIFSEMQQGNFCTRTSLRPRIGGQISTFGCCCCLSLDIPLPAISLYGRIRRGKLDALTKTVHKDRCPDLTVGRRQSKTTGMFPRSTF